MPKIKLARVGQWRTVKVKKGVYIHVRKTKRGVTVARHLRRTKARARKTGKPRIQRI